jgi:chitinase
MAENDLKPQLDKVAGVKWITWDSDQWVSYDDADTLKLKTDFANNLGLAGMSMFDVHRIRRNAPTDCLQWYGR